LPDPPAGNDGSHDLKSSHTDSNDVPGEGRFICDVSEYRMDKNLHETTVFSVNDVSLWPGSIVRGADINKGVLNPIVADRAPLTIGTDLTGLSAEEGSREIADPNNLTAQGAFNEIVQAYLDGPGGGTIGAKLSFTETFIEEFNQSMLDLGISTSWWNWGSGSIQTGLSVSTENYASSYMCRFSQVYFTVSVDPPSQPADMFAPGIQPDDLEGYMEDGDPPCYVSSVTYGRTGFLAVHSNASKDSVRLSVNAAFESMGWDTETQLNTEFVNILNSSEIKILIRGGDASDGVIPIIGDPIQGMKAWIENGAVLENASDAVPISYTVRYLKDSRLASFAYANEWTVEDCRPVTLFFESAVPKLYCHSADDGWAGGNIEVYYKMTLEFEPFEGADLVEKIIEHRPAGNYVSMSGGSTHPMPDAWHRFWMPEQKGSRFRLVLHVSEADDTSGDDRIGRHVTDWYSWPDWRIGGSCTYPAGFPEVGGESATCSARLQEDAGTDVEVFWEISCPVPTKDW
jgi:hypothetical protein